MSKVGWSRRLAAMLTLPLLALSLVVVFGFVAVNGRELSGGWSWSVETGSPE